MRWLLLSLTVLCFSLFGADKPDKFSLVVEEYFYQVPDPSVAHEFSQLYYAYQKAVTVTLPQVMADKTAKNHKLKEQWGVWVILAYGYNEKFPHYSLVVRTFLKRNEKLPKLRVLEYITNITPESSIDEEAQDIAIQAIKFYKNELKRKK